MVIRLLASLMLSALPPALPPSSQSPGAVPAAGSCQVPPNAAVLFWLGDRDAAAGDHLSLQALWTDNPGHFEPIPARCLSALAVDDTKIATPDRDGRGVALARAAPDGSVVTVSAMLGIRPVRGRIRIAAPGANPLLGRWREDGVSRCAIEGATPSPIGEVEFRGNGGFSITWQPFELSHDYLGTYRYDPVRRVLTLVIDGGALTPGRPRQAGRAHLTGIRTLSLVGFDFGAPAGRHAHRAGCAISFVRLL